MSAWKLATRRVYDLGGSATMKKIDDGLINGYYGGLTDARLLGLISSTWQRGHGEGVYILTEKGRLWCEGKLRDTRGEGTAKSQKSLGFIATWLRALPETVALPTPWQRPLFE